MPYGYRQLFEESVSQITATNSVPLGSRRIEGGKEYVYVYNMSTSTAQVGYGVVPSAASGYSVTVSSVIGEKAFGIVQNTDLEPANYGWVQVKGIASVEIGGTTVTCSAGRGVYLIADGLVEPVQTGATGSTWVAANFGMAIDEIATGASGNAYINCLG
jgi:hypothetical protein